MRSTPSLAMLAALCCALLIGLQLPQAATHAQTATLTGPSRVYLPLLRGSTGVQTPEERAASARVVALINQHRAQAGCPPLASDERLTAAAQNHSKDMAVNNFFDHQGSSGAAVGERASAAGYTWRRVGENIAAGQNSPEAVVAAWMNSPGHRANILNCSYRQTGVGFVYQADDQPLEGDSWPLYRYWTQVFAEPR